MKGRPGPTRRADLANVVELMCYVPPHLWSGKDVGCGVAATTLVSRWLFFFFILNLREIFLPVALGKTPRQADPTYAAAEGGDETLREQQ